MIKAAIYARFSTDQQREASIADQVRMGQRTADSGGLSVVATFEDRGISGGTSERPGYQALLKAARNGAFAVIIAEDVSRLWRNRSEYGQRSAELEDLGVDLVTCVGDDTRRDGYGLVLGIKQAIAESARREISYRTRRGLEGRALAGAPTGGKCYGYKVVYAATRDTRDPLPGTVEIDDLEASVVQAIFEFAAAGKSTSWIALEINNRGFKTPRGGERWRRTTVSRILRNSRYTGAVIYGRTRVKTSASDSKRTERLVQARPIVDRVDRKLQIVTRDLFDRARAKVAEKTCRTPRPGVASSPPSP